MKRLLAFTALLILCSNFGHAQTSSTPLPFSKIPDQEGSYTGGNVLSRMIDGLGFRYYWATEGLTEKDLEFIPTEESRNTMETITHLFGLSQVILNGAKNVPNIQPVDYSKMTYSECREKTLLSLQEASGLLAGKSEAEIAALKIIFQRGENKAEYPFWNMINGPIADMIYHSGQVVLLRRMSGNPINPKVNVFLGNTGD